MDTNPAQVDKEWTIFLNSYPELWSGYSLKAANDVPSVTDPVSEPGDVAVNFTIPFEGSGDNQATMKQARDKTPVTLPFNECSMAVKQF